MPVYAAAFGFFVFASAGLPGLSGFVGEFLVLIGAFTFSPAVATVATFSMILAAAYLLWMYQRVVFGELSEFLRGLGHHLTDMTPTEILTLAPLGALVVVFGLFPGLLLNLVAGSVANVLADVSGRVPVPVPPEAAVIAIAIPIAYVVLRLIYVTYADHREPLEPGRVAR
jgi:NADH-quinone oxidoreductase subunit M